MTLFNDGSRSYQDRFDTRRLADRIDERLVRDWIDDDDRAFIERCDMLFVATADTEGRPQCSYKGGDTGFVRVMDEHTIAFPNYDGNGMFLSAGNALVNPHVGLLFINFEERKRLRLNGDRGARRRRSPARRASRRRSSSGACRRPRCSRTVRATSTTTRWSSTRASCRRRTASTPVPDWKRREWARDVLPSDDPANAAG